MRIGVVFPQTEIDPNPAAIRDFAQAVEGLGYTHLLAYEHVLGAGTANRPDWRGAYSEKDPFHEPFVLFAYLAGLTTQLEFVFGVLVLPQRQTALVAKQAAELDLLSGGRLRLGVGVGWNRVEYEALGENFHNRGRRIEEQIALLRRLWTEPVVDFTGKYHRISEAGINPLPVQRPIPIWIGGYVEDTLRRVARMGDGWFPQVKSPAELRDTVERLRGYVRQEGRDPSEIGIEARINLRGDPASWQRELEAWRDLGATHLSVNTMGAGLTSPQAHIEVLTSFAGEMGVPDRS